MDPELKDWTQAWEANAYNCTSFLLHALCTAWPTEIPKNCSAKHKQPPMVLGFALIQYVSALYGFCESWPFDAGMAAA